ncbi:MAG: AI-2E family transporter [Bacteroidetes bacterium]|nr:AI-2E family transporter [Bacteroidota bacterium]
MMSTRTKQILRFLLGAFGVFLLLWIFYMARQVFAYFAISVVIALMGRPLMKLLDKLHFRKKHMPTWLSAAIVMFSFLFVIVLLIRFLYPIISDQIYIIANLDVQGLLSGFDKQFDSLERTLQKLNVKDVNRDMLIQQITSVLDFSQFGAMAAGILSGFGSFLIGFMSVLFITFFLLKDQEIVNNIIDTVTPDRYLKSVYKIITETRQLLSRYFIGIALQVSIIATIVGVGLTIVGVPNALLIGVLAGIFNIIPYLGPIIGGVMGLTLSILSNAHAQLDESMMPLILEVLSVFCVAQLTDNFILQPVIFSKSVKAHPLEIFIVIMVAGMIMGVVGMILAVPMYTFLRIVAKEFFQGYKVVQGLTKDL